MDPLRQPLQLETERLAPKTEENKTPEPQPGQASSPEMEGTMEEKVVAVLRTCFDPEVPVNIFEMGLIYGIETEPAGEVRIKMTLTSPACPVAGSLPGEVQNKVKTIPGINAVKVDLVWEPPWEMSRMSEAAKLQLGMF